MTPTPRDGKRITVEGVLTAGHKGAAVEVTFDPELEWGLPETALWPGRRGWAVEVSLNGTRFRSAIVGRMRKRFVLVDDDLARRAGARIGREVRLTVWPDIAHESTSRAAGTTGPGSGGVGRGVKS